MKCTQCPLLFLEKYFRIELLADLSDLINENAIRWVLQLLVARNSERQRLLILNRNVEGISLKNIWCDIVYFSFNESSSILFALG